MSHLIEKHQQNKKGKGVIRRRSFLSPEQEEEYKRQYQSYTTARSDNTKVQPAVIKNQVSNANTAPQVQRRRTAIQTNKSFKTTQQIEKQKEEQKQYDYTSQERPWYSPTSWIKDWSRVPIVGVPATMAEGLYAGMNWLTGNKGAARYWWEQANKTATPHTIGTIGAAAHTNPVTAAIFDGASIGIFTKDLDDQYNFVQHPSNFKNVPNNEKVLYGMAILPSILNSDEILITGRQGKPILGRDLAELERMVENGEYIERISPYNGQPIKIYRPSGGKQIVREDELLPVLEKYRVKEKLTPEQTLAAASAEDYISKMMKDYGINFSTDWWFSDRSHIPKGQPGAVEDIDIEFYKSHIPEIYDILKREYNKSIIPNGDGTWSGLIGGSFRPVSSPQEYIASLTDAFRTSGYTYDGRSFNTGKSLKDYNSFIRNADVGNATWLTTNRQQANIFAAERAEKQRELGSGRIATSLVGKEPLYQHQVVPHKYARAEQNSENLGVTTFDAPIEYSVRSPNTLYGDWKILGKDMQVKALRGSNLNFSHPTNPYKMLTIPLILGGIAYGTQE